MRKVLVTLILAATAMTPVTASAQDEGDGPAERVRQQRSEQSVRPNAVHRAERVEQRQQRVEQRQQRIEQRTARQESRQQPQPQVEAEQGVPIRAINRRGERNLSRSTNGGVGATTQSGRGEWRQERREDRQDWRQDRREDRRDWRQERREDRQDWQRDGRQDPGEWRHERREDRRDWRQDRREDRRDWRQDRRSDRRDWRREWNRSSWRNDRRYDWHSWRYRNRSLFRLSPYYSPYRNWGYSRFSIGLFLEPLFYSNRYWLNDPYQYRLPPAPPGTRWIRYYNDVLLVDTWSGEVVDVIYNFFW